MSTKVYTIGFTKKSAEEFFNTLKNHNVKVILDVRLNNTSQLAGFAKYPDIKYFLREICGIRYIHDKNFAPTKELLKSYRNKLINWNEYEQEFNKLLEKRNLDKSLKKLRPILDKLCLLCSEAKPDNCHRKLVAEYIKRRNLDLDIEIIHL